MARLLLVAVAEADAVVLAAVADVVEAALVVEEAELDVEDAAAVTLFGFRLPQTN